MIMNQTELQKVILQIKELNIENGYKDLVIDILNTAKVKNESPEQAKDCDCEGLSMSNW